jgi:hypothetical protein
MTMCPLPPSTLIKKNIKFSSYMRKLSGYKVIYEEGLPNTRGNTQIFSHI